MASINLIEAFQDFKEAENIDRPTMMKVVEDVFKTLLRKKYGSDENFDVIVNAEKGDLEIMRRRTIVNDGEVTALAGSKVLSQLASLDVSRGRLGDKQAQVLIDEAGAFKHLKELNVSRGCMSPEFCEKLTGVFTNISVADQREPHWAEDDEDEDSGRYDAVGE